MKLKDKIIFTLLYIVMIVGFTFALINKHKYANIHKEDLTFVTEVFLNSKKTKSTYDIVCESGNKYHITQILADDEHLDMLEQGDLLELGLNGNSVIVLVSNGETIISIDDCNQRYAKNFKTSIIVLPSVMVGIILLQVGIHFLFKKIEKDYVEGNYKSNSEKINEKIDDKVYKSIQDSIYKKNGYLRCNILEQIESDELVYTFYKAMIDYLNDRELVLLIDDGCIDDGLAMAFYKDGNKLYFNTIFREENKPFEIERSLFWYYPFDAKVTKEESEAFVYAVDEYMTFNKDLLKYTSKQK